MTLAVTTDYQTAGLSLKSHPMRSLLRTLFNGEGVLGCDLRPRAGRLPRFPSPARAGRHGGNGNVVFCTIDDETGIANIVVWSSLLQPFPPRHDEQQPAASDRSSATQPGGHHPCHRRAAGRPQRHDGGVPQDIGHRWTLPMKSPGHPRQDAFSPLPKIPSLTKPFSTYRRGCVPNARRLDRFIDRILRLLPRTATGTDDEPSHAQRLPGRQR